MPVLDPHVTKAFETQGALVFVLGQIFETLMVKGVATLEVD